MLLVWLPPTAGHGCFGQHVEGSVAVADLTAADGQEVEREARSHAAEAQEQEGEHPAAGEEGRGVGQRVNEHGEPVEGKIIRSL